jgi:predicted nucleic acid-binding protein
MRAPRCTIDSSCLIALDHLDLLPQLSLLFSRVLIPKAVREDLFKRRSTKDRLQVLFASYAFLERCDDYDEGTVDFLLADPWGRELAASDDLDYHGTFWVLRRFYELGLISAPAIRSNFVALFHRGTRLPREIVNAFLVEIGQDPL